MVGNKKQDILFSWPDQMHIIKPMQVDCPAGLTDMHIITLYQISLEILKEFSSQRYSSLHFLIFIMITKISETQAILNKFTIK